MKKIFFINLLFLFAFCANIAGQTDTPKKLCRPVKTGKHNFSTKDGKLDITIFGGEWFKVEAETIGNAVIGNDTLKSDADNCVLVSRYKKEYKDCESLDIKVCRYNDSIYVNVPKTAGTKWYFIIDQTKNTKIDSCSVFDKFVKFTLDKNSVLRVSPENRVCSVFKPEEVKNAVFYTDSSESVKVEVLEYDSLVVDTLSVIPLSGQSSGNESEIGLFIIIAGILLILLAIALVYYFFKKSKYQWTNVTNEYKEQNEQDVISNENNQEDLTHLKIKKITKKPLFTFRTDIIYNMLGTDGSDEYYRFIKKTKENSKSESTSKGSTQSKDTKKISKLQAEIEQIKIKYENQLATTCNQYDSRIVNLNKKIKDLEDNENKIKENLRNKYQADIDKLKHEKDAANKKCSETQEKLDKTKKTLDERESTLVEKNREIENLKQAQAEYTRSLTFVPFAHDYSVSVSKLLDVAHNLQSEAYQLLSCDVSDTYHILKAISKFSAATSKIEMPMLFTDIKMITEGNLVLKSSTLSSYNDTGDKKTIEGKVSQYFFDKYLNKYIDALVVFNESLVGLERLIEGVPSAMTNKFVDYRDVIAEHVSNLGLVVETVHLFDQVGEKIGLNATMVDANFNSGEILEIENCLVYFKEGRKPEDKIKVKVQE